MPQLLSAEKEGSLFVLHVQLETGHKERWIYQREQVGGLTSYIMVDREDG
jgi:hypothetical protein